MTHRHIETITFGICLVICALTHTHTHARTRTHARKHFDIGTGTVGAALPSSVGWLPGGGVSLLLSHMFTGGGVENYLRGGVWEGVLFFVSQDILRWIFICVFGFISSCPGPMKVAGRPCYAVQCCGVLWSCKV